MEKALEKLLLNIADLFKVKSLITIIMTIVLALIIMKKIEVVQEVLVIFSTSYGAVITYFFTKKENQETGKIGE